MEVRTLPSFSYVSVGSKFAQVNCLPIRVISHKSKLSITSMKRKAIERCIDHCCFLHYFLKMLKSTPPPPKKKGLVDDFVGMYFSKKLDLNPTWTVP